MYCSSRATISILCTLLLPLCIQSGDTPEEYQIIIHKGSEITGPLYYTFCSTTDKNGKVVLPDNAPIGAITDETKQMVDVTLFPAITNTLDLRSNDTSDHLYLFVSTNDRALVDTSTGEPISEKWQKLIASKRIPYKTDCRYTGSLVFTVTQKKNDSLSISMKDKRNCRKRSALIKKGKGSTSGVRTSASGQSRDSIVRQSSVSGGVVGPEDEAVGPLTW